MSEALQLCIEESGVLYFFGLLTLLYVTVSSLLPIYKFLTIHFTRCGVNFEEFGKWALVTGSTDGIGKGIATELARQSINIVLVSRNADKLKNVAAELERKFAVDTKCVAFDFTSSDENADVTSSVYDVIKDAISDLEIGILVNNVGKSTGRPYTFLKCFETPEKLAKGSTDLVNCNMTSMSKVTQIVLPQMLGRGKGLVINLSSIAADIVYPTSSMYSSSKRFNDTFSQSLRLEYASKGIVIQSIKPGRVATNMTQSNPDKVRKPGIFFPPYQDYVKHLMRTVGKAHESTGYWFHHIQKQLVTRLPDDLVAWAMWRPEPKQSAES